MAFYDKFPYTNFQEINLDRLIKELVEVKNGLDFVIENSSLKYANPIQWNITSQYQANTVVIDPGTGIAYLSTKPVPNNILITDTGYWTQIFDLSALFSSLQNDIGTVANDLTTETNNRVNADNTLQGNITAEETARINADNTLQGNITAEETARINADNALQNNINAEASARSAAIMSVLNNSARKFIFISDSYGDGANTWIPKLINRAGLYGRSWGQGFSGQGFWVNSHNGFLEGLQSMTISADPSEITDIVVAGGANDLTTSSYTTQLGDQITAFCQYCHTTYPNATIWIGMIGYCLFGSTYAGSADLIPYIDTVFWYKKYAAENSAMYMNNVELVMHNYTYISSDGLHPNQDGQDAITNAIFNTLFANGYTGYGGVDFMRYTSTVTINNATSGFLGYVWSMDGSTFWDMPEITTTSQITLGQAYTKFFDISQAYDWYGNTEIVFQTTAQAIESGSTNFINIPVFIRIYRGAVYLASTRINSGVYETHTYNTIILYAQRWTTPTIMN